MDATESRAGERLAVPALAAAGVLWGVSFLFGKWALEEMGPAHVTLTFRLSLGGLAALRVAQRSVARTARPASFLAGGVPHCAGYLPGAVLGTLANRRHRGGPDRGLRPADGRVLRASLPRGEARQDRVDGGRGVDLGCGARRRQARRLQQLTGRRAGPAIALGRGRVGAPGQAPGRRIPGRASHRLEPDLRNADPGAWVWSPGTVVGGALIIGAGVVVSHRIS